MKNLIRFLTENSFVFLFVFLMVISFFLLVTNNNYQNSKVFNSSNFLIGNLFSTINNVEEYFSLKDDNIELSKQNAVLLANQIQAYTKVNENVIKINDAVYTQNYTYIPAKVVNNTTNKRDNYITINKGSISGVEPGMGVISAQGVIGTVKNVSENFCSVMSVLHGKNAVSAKIKKSGYKGSLVWELGNYRVAQLRDIPNHVTLNKNDSIITTGYSMVYPEGVLVGRVIDYNLPKGDNFYKINIELSVDYKSLSHVFIVKSWMKDEQKELEEINEIEE